MDLLQMSVCILVAVYAVTTVNADYTVITPKIIRPGTDINIQYNTRNGKPDLTKVVTEIYQLSIKKYTTSRTFTPGQVFSSSLSIPRNLKPGSATIIVRFEKEYSPDKRLPSNWASWALYAPPVRFEDQSTLKAEVKVVNKSVSMFIQTDKGIYSPSQDVNFRVIVIDPEMLPYRGSCDVEIKDAEGNKIKQWKAIDLDTGTLTLKMELSDQPVLGDWTIRAITDGGEIKEKTFAVDKYVLPKFEVTVDTPSYILVGDSQVKATVNAKYTYGKGLDGTATVTVTNPSISNWGYDFFARQNVKPRTLEFKGITLVDGKVDVVLTAKQLKVISYEYRGLQHGNRIAITVNVTEKLTGKARASTSEVKVFKTAEKLEFLSSSPNTFKPGLPYTGFLRLSQVDGGVVTNPKNVTVTVTDTSTVPAPDGSNDLSIDFTQAGLAEVSIVTPKYAQCLDIHAKYDNLNAVQKRLYRTESKSNTFIQLSTQSSQLKVGSQATFMIHSTKPGLTVDYQVWSRGSMVTSGTVQVDTQTYFSIQMEANMAPSARVIAFTKVGDELIVDGLNINLEGAFDRNQVSVSYSKDKAKPGEKVDVKVTAVSGSLVGLLAVDQSVLLLAGGNDITQADVVSELGSYDTGAKPASGGQYWLPYSVSGRKTAEMLDNSGVVEMSLYNFPCDAPADGTNTARVYRTELGHQQRYTYSCRYGYTTTDPLTVTCDNGRMTPGPPKCTAVSCGKPLEGVKTVAVGQVSLSYGQHYTYTCQSGYGTTNTRSVSCMASGRFSRLPPTCVISCGKPAEGVNTFAVGQVSLIYGQSYAYTCQTGYSTKDKRTVQCTATRDISPGPPTCSVVSCGKPAEGVKTVAVGNVSLIYSESYTYSCMTGFHAWDQLRVTCTARGHFSPGPPVCGSPGGRPTTPTPPTPHWWNNLPSSNTAGPPTNGNPPRGTNVSPPMGVHPPKGFNPSPPTGANPPRGTNVSPPTGANPPKSPPAEIVVRKVFPESWLWSNITSVNGQVIVTTTVPDTITSWVASAFAVSEIAGLGVSAETAKIQVFRPFFVSLNLPYSVVRGEELVLQAIVFNYMNRDTNVTVTLPASDEYKSIVVDASGSTKNVKQQETITILAKANRGTTTSFPMVPLTIGKMRIKVTATTPGAADAVQRDLLVEAEGVEKEYNQAVLITCQNSSFTETVAIDFPPNTVSDSARVEFSLIGDVMGPAINGLDKLIKMPYGCGEQNMVNFAPTIFVTEYLSLTKQLTAELQAKSIGFMEKGYQRELTYQRNDGSFSAWGQNDPSGSMWLTAFVAKSFQKARDFIYVDEETIVRAVNWIVSRQNNDGSFPEPGRLIHKDMSGGGASSKATLTAYVLITISEVKLSSPSMSHKISIAQSKAQKYLEMQPSSISNPYSMALTAYALFKSGSSNVDRTFNSLMRLSKTEGSFQYWQQAQPKPAYNNRAWRSPHQQGRAVDIEMTAYVLQFVTEKSIGQASPILNWVSAQRNSFGGFASSQDTVVALQALAKYSRSIRGDPDMTVLTSAAGQTNTYSVNAINALVLQSKVLDPDTKLVTISASGSGSALAQISATYNVEDYEQEPAFDTIATIMSESDNKIGVRVCTRWLLAGTTGMAVAEIGIPSGFSADVETLEDMNYPGLKRIEEGDRKIILYFDELGSDERCVDVDADREGLVAKAKPVAVKVYDYYEPENQQTIFYSSTRLNNINICDVCGASCEGCTAYFKRK